MYWINESASVGSNRQMQFYVDTNEDIDNLPTSVSYGAKQGNDIIYYLPCGIGSNAISIATGDRFVLNSSNEWTLVGSVKGSSNGYVSADQLNDIGTALLSCIKNVAWVNENGQDYYDLLKDAFGITEEESEWDYEWDVSSEEIPEGMSYTAYQFTGESLMVTSPNLNFNHVGDCEIEIECKWYMLSGSGTMQNPQIIVVTSSSGSDNSGGKFLGNPTSGRNVQSNISGTMTDMGVSCDSYHIFNVKAESGTITLTIDGNVVSSGSGVSNNQYIPYTGIAGNNINGCGLYIKSIKFKKA